MSYSKILPAFVALHFFFDTVHLRQNNKALFSLCVNASVRQACTLSLETVIQFKA